MNNGNIFCWKQSPWIVMSNNDSTQKWHIDMNGTKEFEKNDNQRQKRKFSNIEIWTLIEGNALRLPT